MIIFGFGAYKKIERLLRPRYTEIITYLVLTIFPHQICLSINFDKELNVLYFATIYFRDYLNCMIFA